MKADEITKAMELVKEYGTLVYPMDYPMDEERWRDEVKKYMEIAVWKGVKRLATTGVDQISEGRLGQLIEILYDKLMVQSGQATNITQIQQFSISHRDMLKSLQDRKGLNPLNSTELEGSHGEAQVSSMREGV